MSKQPQDNKPDGKDARRHDREARLAEALRANLKRRKAQERGRKAGGPKAAGPDGDDASGG